MESAFEIIAEPNRRAILSLLASSEQSVSEIEDELQMSQPSVSKHLRVLREAGFVYASESPDGPIPQVGLGIRFDGRSEGTGLPPPKLGAHTDQILASWLDCSTTELDQLRAQRVI